MSGRKNKQDIYINNKKVVGVIEAAGILTEKAKRQGSNRVYSRDAVYRHYQDGKLTPAVETPAGNLYYVEDIENLPITPQRGRPGRNTA